MSIHTINSIQSDTINKSLEPDYIISGIFKNSKGLNLKLGTLLKSAGNSNSITRNITKQLSSRLASYNLKHIYCVKFCVPIVNSTTKTCVQEVVNSIFVSKSESFIDTKENLPKILFVKVLFDQKEVSRNFLGIFSKATGSLVNIHKFISKQLDSHLETKKEIIENLDLVDFEIPNCTQNTIQVITTILDKKFGENKFSINMGLNSILFVTVELK